MRTQTDFRVTKRRSKQYSDEDSEEQQAKKRKDGDASLGDASLGEDDVLLNNGDVKGQAQDDREQSPNARSQSFAVYRAFQKERMGR